MILGRDLLQELGIDLDFKENSITWGDYQANMKSPDIALEKHVANIETTKAAAADIAKILDAKYHKIDLHTDKHEELLNSTLGMWKNFQYDIELQNSVTLYHSKLYTVLKAYKETLWTEVERLCQIGVLWKVNQL
eukprot:12535686-Ditylum_brightwellii.AAC.1